MSVLIPLDELTADQIPDIRWVIRQAARPGFCPFGADSGTGKTTAISEIAMDAADGRDVFGCPRFEVPEPTSVLIYSTEETIADWHERLEALKTARGRPRRGIYVCTLGRVDGAEARARIAEDLEETGARLVFIDVFADVEPDILKNSAPRLRPLIHAWNVWAMERDVAIIGTTHTYRGGVPAAGEWTDKLMGSKALIGASVVRWGLSRPKGAGRAILRVNGKLGRTGTDHDTVLTYNPQTGEVLEARDELAPEEQQRRDREAQEARDQALRDQILLAVRQNPGIRMDEVSCRAITALSRTDADKGAKLGAYAERAKVARQMAEEGGLRRESGRYWTPEDWEREHRPPAPALEPGPPAIRDDGPGRVMRDRGYSSRQYTGIVWTPVYQPVPPPTGQPARGLDWLYKNGPAHKPAGWKPGEQPGMPWQSPKPPKKPTADGRWREMARPDPRMARTNGHAEGNP